MLIYAGRYPILYLLGRIHGYDLCSEPDMHIALWRKVGRPEGVAGLLGDFAKGAIAVFIARSLGLSTPAVALAGQMWPVFLRFDGDKDNNTGLTMVAAYPGNLWSLASSR